ncbi:MAG: hypothetical protein A3H27_14980 [Acidobacteria bacterium RIFCSPLOWO2_02_FULL_59_13]|nr:MAG: hypothetical protein A3H27_14980 [Acidobacteria bacterium RIFCSPLOWO2_02_FULL_59_13]
MVGPLISPEVMEKTWQAVGAMQDAEIKRRQALCGKEQDELTAFVFAYLSDVAPEAMGLGLYAHLVVIEAFRRSGVQFRKLKPGRIESTWKDNFGFINELRAAGRPRAPFRLGDELSSEPAVMQYVIDALTEENEDDPINVSDDDFWRILHVLKTVSDCMHSAQRTR